MKYLLLLNRVEDALPEAGTAEADELVRAEIIQREDRGMLSGRDSATVLEAMDDARLDALVYPFKSLGAPLVGTSDGGTRDNPISSTASPSGARNP